MIYRIDDKDLDLQFTMSIWGMIEETSGQQLHELLADLDTPKRIRALTILLCCMARGDEITPAWLDEHLVPTFKSINAAAAACNRAIAIGMKVEKDESAMIDETYEQLSKKAEPGA